MRRISRRHALAGVAAGIGIAGRTARGAQANSAVTVGIIGTGSRGRFDLGIFAQDGRARIAALCDISSDAIDATKTAVPGTGTARVYKDYREVLADPSIDAVLIATPVFLHPEHFEAAVKARKHIYIEKPAGADVAGVKRLLTAAQQADPSKHIVLGFQNRYSPEYHVAEDIVRTGKLGELLMMECHFIRGGDAAKPVHAPEERIKRWGAWRGLSGDFIVEQDCHGLDVLNWFAGKHPIKAIGSGGSIKRAYGDNLDHLSVTYEYPGNLRGILVATQLTVPRPRCTRAILWNDRRAGDAPPIVQVGSRRRANHQGGFEAGDHHRRCG
jgi:predicted dehydrogenase